MQIHEFAGFQYIRISELPESDRAAFVAWMVGQTQPMIDDLDPQDACYVWDWDRFNQARKHGGVLWD